MFILLTLLWPWLNPTARICLGVIAVILAYFYYTVKKKQSYWSKKGVKHTKPRFFFGNMEIFRKQPLADKLIAINNEFPNDRYFGNYQFLMPILSVKDPDLIKQITIKSFDHFVNRRDVGNSEWDHFWSKNLFASRDEKWRDLRATLSPSFTSSKMRVMFPLIEEIAQQFVKFYNQQNEEVLEFEVKDALSRYTNDVIANTAFGLKVDSLSEPNNEFYLTGKDVANFDVLRFLKFFLNSISPTLSKLLRLKVIPARIERYFSNVIEETVKTRREKNIVRPDMIHLLMEAQKGRQHMDEDISHLSEGFSTVSESELTRKNRKQEITDEDINAQAFIFFLAGFDTVSTHITFTFYELAVNSDVQTRLRDEINSVEEPITYETLLGLKYLDMVVSEALRKWPPVVIVDRQVSKDFTIEPVNPEEKPLRLEKGFICMIPIFALHHDEKYYPEPERFDPERFSEENRHKINPLVYLPFGTGPRNCIGSRFALLESKLILYHILKNFEVVPVSRTNIPMVLDKKQINIAAKGGMWLGLKKIPGR